MDHKSKNNLPILYSFRRCPYAMRARMAIHISGQKCELREVLLRDKPPSMLEYSSKGTVPVLVLQDKKVIDESLDVIDWALNLNDPDNWLRSKENEETKKLIEINDGEFKHHLDRYKYSTRYEDEDPVKAKEALIQAEKILDSTASKKVLHKNAAARYKSRLNKAVKALG